MGCCEEWKTDCDQGKNCPVRRRVRAGTCAPDIEPEHWARISNEMMGQWRQQQDRADRLAALFIASCVAFVVLIVWLTT